MMLVASCIPFPFFAPCDAMLAMLVCATRWLSMHLYTLAYMSMHESCLLVSSMLQHNEVMDIQSKPTFLPRRHLILFTFSLVCLLYCSFACYAYHAYLLYAISYALHTSSFHRLSAVFLIFAFASTHIERGRMELGAWSPRHKHVDTSQVAMFSRFRSPIFPFGYLIF